MKNSTQELTHHQKLVSKSLRDNGQNIEPEFHEAFMKAMCIALRDHHVPVSLISRSVSIKPYDRTNPNKLFALVIDQKPIGRLGEIGWKAISQTALKTPEMTLVFSQSSNRATRWAQMAYRDNIVIQALLSRVNAYIEAEVLAHKTALLQTPPSKPRL